MLAQEVEVMENSKQASTEKNESIPQEQPNSRILEDQANWSTTVNNPRDTLKDLEGCSYKGGNYENIKHSSKKEKEAPVDDNQSAAASSAITWNVSPSIRYLPKSPILSSLIYTANKPEDETPALCIPDPKARKDKSKVGKEPQRPWTWYRNRLRKLKARNVLTENIKPVDPCHAIGYSMEEDHEINRSSIPTDHCEQVTGDDISSGLVEESEAGVLEINWENDDAALEAELNSVSSLGKRYPYDTKEAPAPTFAPLFIFEAATSIKPIGMDEANYEFKCMFDCGASGNFLSNHVPKVMDLPVYNCAPLMVKVASNKVLAVTQYAHVPIQIGSYHTTIPAYILPNPMEIDLILGLSWQHTMDRGRVTTDIMERTIEFHDKGTRHTVKCQGRPTPKLSTLGEPHFEIISGQQGMDDMQHWNTLPAEDRPEAFLLHPAELNKILRDGSFESRDPNLKDEEYIDGMESEVETLTTEFAELFAEKLGVLDVSGKHEYSVIPIKQGMEHQRPFNKARKMNAYEREQLALQLKELIDLGYLRAGASPYGAPAMLVPKPHQPDKLRLVIDYRALNKITEKLKYPLPNTDQLFESLSGSTVFSSFDCLWGYWQWPLPKEEQERTAMMTPMGQFIWNVIPMGVTNAPGVFMQLMDDITRDLVDEDGKCFVKVFIDDLIVHSKDVESHKKHLRLLFERLKSKNLKLKRSKAQFFTRSVKFLGHVIKGDPQGTSIAPQSSKVKAIEEWPIPKSVTEIRQFLGLVGFYRRYINNFADKAKPLTELLKKGAEVNVSTISPESAAHAAFNALVSAMTQAPVLILPDEPGARDGTRPFVIQTDASGYAIGAVLMQDVGRGLQPITFLSRSLNPAEQNYTTTERELLGLVFATHEWQHLLYGARCVLQGDHKPLEQLFSPTKELTRRQARWIEHLIKVGVPDMQYVPGKTIPVPDALSRRVDHQLYTPREGLQQQLQGNWSSQADPDLMTAWTLDLHEMSPPSVINYQTNMCFFTNIAWDVEVVLRSLTEFNEVLETEAFDPVTETQGVYQRARDYRQKLRRRNRVVTQSSEELDTNSDWTLTSPYFNQLLKRFGKFDVDLCCDLNGVNKQPGCATFWHPKLSCLDTEQQMEGLKMYANPPWTTGFVKQLLERYYTAKSNNAETSLILVLPDYIVKKVLNEKLRRKYGLEVVERWNTTEDQEEMFKAPGYPAGPCPYEILVLYGAPASELKQDAWLDEEPIVQPEWTSRSLLTKLEAAYMKDTKLQTQMQTLIQEGAETSTKLKVYGNFLWEVTKGYPRMVVPDDIDLKQFVIKEYHEAPHAGHFDEKRTLEKIARRFYWLNMEKDVISFCKGCAQCQLNNRRKPAGQRHPLVVPNRRWSVITMDFIQGLTMSKSGNDALLTVTDKFSKRVHLIPYRSKGSTSATIAKLYFDNIWKLHGAPLKFVSDRDVLFVNSFYKSLHQLIGTQLRFTSPYHPQADGQSERTNQTVKNTLRKYVGTKSKEWDEHIAAVEFAINDTICVHGYTPFEIDTGQSPSNPLDFVLDSIKQQNGYNPKATRYLTEMQQSLEEVRTLLEKSAIEMRAKHAEKHEGKLDFGVNDDVLLHMADYVAPQSKYATSALRNRYCGPFRIVEAFYSERYYVLCDKRDEGTLKPSERSELDETHPCSFRLELPAHWSIHNVVSVTKLKKFTAGSWPCQKFDPEDIEITEIDGHAEFKVRSITDDILYKRPNGASERRWLVNWKGHSDDYSLYLPESSINTGTPKEYNDVWLDYERRRAARLNQKWDNPAISNLQVMESRVQVKQLAKNKREFNLLIMAPDFEEALEVVRELEKQLPRARISVLCRQVPPVDSMAWLSRHKINASILPMASDFQAKDVVLQLDADNQAVQKSFDLLLVLPSRGTYENREHDALTAMQLLQCVNPLHFVFLSTWDPEDEYQPKAYESTLLPEFKSLTTWNDVTKQPVLHPRQTRFFSSAFITALHGMFTQENLQSSPAT